MTFQEVLHFLLWHGAQIHRTSEPGVFYELDGAEGGKYGIWKHDNNTDDMTDNRRFGMEELTAIDWNFVGVMATRYKCPDPNCSHHEFGAAE